MAIWTRAKLINSTQEENFQNNLNESIEKIEQGGFDIKDIKFSTDKEDFSALIIYTEEEDDPEAEA